MKGNNVKGNTPERDDFSLNRTAHLSRVKNNKELLNYLEHIESRALDHNYIDEPMCYISVGKRKQITLDISQWRKIKKLAIGEKY